jgi:hypothetical protein
MRSGGKAQVIKVLTKTFRYFFFKWVKILTPTNPLKWSIFHFSTDNLFISDNLSFFDKTLRDFTTPPTTFNYSLSNNFYTADSNISLKSFLFDNIYDNTPIFGFYIRKVSKDIRKNSRGKSGKYMIIWKYIPVYKRLYVTMR